MKRALAAFVMIGLAVGLLTGCTQAVAPAATHRRSRQVTDLLGRNIEVPEEVNRVVAIGPGALRLVCYAQAADKVVGIEELELQKPIRRPYLLANPSLLDLEVIGPGGPDSIPDKERLLEVAPDVILVAQLVDKNAADELQAATKIPVVVLNYGSLGTYGRELFTSLDVVGEVLGRSEHTTRVASFIRSTLADLESRSSRIPEAQRPTAYVGALGFKGAHGVESTNPSYPPFVALGAKNVAGDLNPKGNVMIDKEKLLVWNPQFVFLDCSGMSLVIDDVAKNRALYQGLSAVRDKRVFTQFPFNNYSTNIETALGNTYYVGAVMYPQQFSDVEMAAKFDDISNAMLGAPTYQKLSATYKGSLEPIDLLATSK